jgi:glucokinase-like ROK family protein
VARTVSVVSDDRLLDLVAVLDHARRHGSTTRPLIVEGTGLSRAVATQRVSELIEYGLLEEGDLGESRGGRAPRVMRFRAEAGRILVAHLGATSIDVAITDLAATILAHHEEAADIATGPEPVLGRVDELFRDLLRETATSAESIWGIGIGVPGPVEFESGIPVSPPIMPGWDRYPIRKRFAGFRAPVWVDNDVNVMALGEVRAGVAQGHEHMLFVKLGTGIGSGIVVRGKLYRGARGSAGDIGHIEVPGGAAVLCRCGNTGCLEALAGGAALARDAEAAAAEGRSTLLSALKEEKGALTAAEIAYAAAHGDPVALELIIGAGRMIGRVLASLVNFFNPSMLVVGGGVAASGDVLLATIRETMYGRSLPLATRDLLVTRSTLDWLGGVTGAATMVTDELFAPVTLSTWIEAGTPAGLLAEPA